MAQKANINREILRWARKTARISLEKAAKTISKTARAERIQDWESDDGKEFPSIKQAEKLARLYRRPVEIFYLQYIPRDFKPLKDFRRNRDEGLSTGIIFMMREVQEKQEWLSNFQRARKQKKLNFAGKYTVKSPVETVARDIRETLGIKTLKPDIKPLRYWIDHAEDKGIYVALSSNFHSRLRLDSDTMKGFVIADSFAPFVFLNSDDWDHGQLFTLVHELVHIWIGVSGICSETGIDVPDADRIHIVEKFCRAVSIAALLPEENLRPFFQVKGDLTLRHISKAARTFGVSNKDILLRAQDLKLIPDETVNSLHREAAIAWKEFLAKEARKPKSSGGPNYYLLQSRRNSRAFATLVMDAHKSGRLQGPEASRLLNVKEANFGKFRDFLFK